MIVLTVLSYNGAPADGPSAQFDELGGTIGRADNNQLVLPDPERTISRVHARVVFRAGKYAIVDNGSNPISVNGTPVGAGREHPLQPGDQLQIGGYVLKAGEAAVGAAAADPFADLFGDAADRPGRRPPAGRRRAAGAGTGTRGRRRPPPARRHASPSPRPGWRRRPGAGPRAGGRPHSRGLGPVCARPRRRRSRRRRSPGTPRPAPSSTCHAAAAIRSTTCSACHGAGPAADPLGAPPAQAHRAAPNMAAHDDPLQSLASAGAPDLPSRPDHFSDLNTPMPLPPAPAAPAARRRPQPAAPLPAGAVFSWNDPPRDGRVVTLPGVRRAALEPPPAADARRRAGCRHRNTARPAPLPPAPAWSAPRPPGSAGSGRACSRRLLAGLGTPDLRLDALTPETMHLIGQLLRESMRGTVELLVARAALKREMRAEMTMIVARENNPLKFSPTVEVALQHLLGPQTPGFMAPAPAVRDAYDDLRAHQLGVMAGMRAALDGVLQRFDPQQLEGKLTHRSAISTLIPATRKARLWESFQELFAQLQAEAQDDFDELFGRAFLRAYEDQLDRMSGEPGPR